MSVQRNIPFDPRMSMEYNGTECWVGADLLAAHDLDIKDMIRTITVHDTVEFEIWR
jgi:hypothetical protein